MMFQAVTTKQFITNDIPMTLYAVTTKQFVTNDVGAVTTKQLITNDVANDFTCCDNKAVCNQ